MAAQGERVSGVVDMDESNLESMVQDGDPEQEMLVVEEQEQTPPQMDPEPEMGAAAAYDTSPPLLHQNPSPIPAETVHPSAPDMAQLFAMLAGMKGDMQQMISKIDGNTQKMDGIKNNTNELEKKMDGMTQTMRGEMQCMGVGLQEGQEQLKGEIGKNMTAVEQFKIGQG